MLVRVVQVVQVVQAVQVVQQEGRMLELVLTCQELLVSFQRP